MGFALRASAGTAVSGTDLVHAVMSHALCERIMELTPLTNSHIDRRLQDIDRQINTALRDIRKNLEELEQASKPGANDVGRADESKDFAQTLRRAMARGGTSG